MESRPLALVEGTTLHAALAFDLKGRQAGLPPTEAESIEVLEAEWFNQLCSSDAPVDFGRTTDEGRVLDRMRALYRHWRGHSRLVGEVVAVEEELRVQFPGVDLPMLGYVDLVLRNDGADQVVDFKTSSSKPSHDELLDPLDLQKLAMTTGRRLKTDAPVARWTWSYLVKTKEPQLVDVSLELRDEDLKDDVRRLVGVVQPTIRRMQAILAGDELPVPTQSYSNMCSNCPYRRPCADWRGDSRPERPESSSNTTRKEDRTSIAGPDDSTCANGELITPILNGHRDPPGCCS
jgi:CRISPR/Cas system-associated exonuclease Cas4 (RecB family)